MKNKRWILTGLVLFFTTIHLNASDFPTTILYHKVLNDKGNYPELDLNNVACEYTPDGLLLTGKNENVRLNKYYSLGDRVVRYHVKFSPDAVGVFQSNTGDFKMVVDISEKTVSVATEPAVWKKMDFIDAGHEYLVEIYHKYQTSKIRIIDVFTGQQEELELTNDGQGGYLTGAVNGGFRVGMQHDYYCFGLQDGTSMLVKQISVIAGTCDLTLLMYGDSITEPEGYYPTSVFSQAWTQLILSNVQGKALCSGRGGCTIREVLERIKNELHFVKAKYVMVTIGTNGGNTEENLSELVEYIISQGSIPILNNIPSNDRGTQVEVNRIIEKVREKYKINGCKFDLATSLANDGKEVDKSTMYYEDLSKTHNWHVYHHPNIIGSRKMYIRTFIDIPEIYE